MCAAHKSICTLLLSATSLLPQVATAGIIHSGVIGPSLALDIGNDPGPGEPAFASGTFSLPGWHADGAVLTGLNLQFIANMGVEVFGRGLSASAAQVSAKSTYQLPGLSVSSDSGLSLNELSELSGPRTVTLFQPLLTAAVTGPALQDYVGLSPVVGRIDERLTVDRTGGDGGQMTTALTGVHAVTISYSYLQVLHADGSVLVPGADAGQIDFGTLTSGANASRVFDLFNAAGSFALQVRAITCTDLAAGNGVDDCTLFALGNNFLDVAGGASAGGLVSFSAPAGVASAGYAARFDLQVGDRPGSDGVGLLEQVETLSLSVTAAVPEPAPGALWLAGLLGVLAAARRRASRPHATRPNHHAERPATSTESKAPIHH